MLLGSSTLCSWGCASSSKHLFCCPHPQQLHSPAWPLPYQYLPAGPIVHTWQIQPSWGLGNFVSSLAAFQKGQDNSQRGTPPLWGPPAQSPSPPKCRLDNMWGNCHSSDITPISEGPSPCSNCGALMAFQQGMRNELDTCTRPPSGYWMLWKKPQIFRKLWFPLSPHLLPLQKGTFGKADGSSFPCRPDPWQRPVLAGAVCVCARAWLQDQLSSFMQQPRCLAVAAVTGYTGLISKTSTSCHQFPRTLPSGTWPRSPVVGQVVPEWLWFPWHPADVLESQKITSMSLRQPGHQSCELCSSREHRIVSRFFPELSSLEIYVGPPLLVSLATDTGPWLLLTLQMSWFEGWMKIGGVIRWQQGLWQDAQTWDLTSLSFPFLSLSLFFCLFSLAFPVVFICVIPLDQIGL